MNNSISKTQYSFTKSSRFTTPKQATKSFAEAYPTNFSSFKRKGLGSGFNSSADRFLKTKSQSVDKVDGPGDLDYRGNGFTRGVAAYQFGVSRESSKKIYIDHISKYEAQKPGPGAHNLTGQFG